MVVRVDRPPFDDARLRQAISLGIDREFIAKTLLGGSAEPAGALVPPVHWAYAPLPPIPFDLGAARERVRDAAGGAIRATLLTSTDRLRTTIARTIAQELAPAGITLDVVPLEFGALLSRLNAGEFELATLTLPEFTEPNVLRVFMHSASIPPDGANRGRIRDAQIDALLDLGASTLDLSERKRAYAELSAVIRRSAAIIPLWHEDQVWLTSARARGFSPSAEGRWLGLAAVR
jgi:peptide/nickel transport system substrate-binding protein